MAGRRVRIVNRPEICADEDLDPVRRHCRCGRSSDRDRGFRPSLVIGGSEPAKRLVVGVDDEPTGGAVDRDRRARCDAERRWPGADHRRNAAGPRQDRAVTRRARRGEHQTAHSRDVQVGHLGRHQVVGNQNTFTLDPRRRCPGERSRHLLPDRMHVEGARPEVVIGDAGELGLDVGDGVHPRTGRRDARSDAGSHRVEQIGVVDEHEVGIEDPGFAFTTVACSLGADPLDVPTHIGDGRADASPLDLVPLWRFVGNLDVRRAHQEGWADRDAGRGRQRRPVRGICSHDVGLRRRDDFLLVEAPMGQRDDVIESFPGLAAGRGQLDPMTAQRAQRGDPREAGGRNRPRTGVEIAELDPGVEQTRLLDEAGRRSRVQSVCVGDLHDHRRGGRGGERRVLLDAVSNPVVAHGRRDRGVHVRLLGSQRTDGLRGHLAGSRSAGGGHRRDHQPLDQRRRAQHHALADAGVDHVERHLGRQHGAPEIHQHDHAFSVVGGLDGFDDGRGVGAERRRVQSGSHGDPHLGSVQHLRCQRHGRVGQRAAVGHHDQSGHEGPPPARTRAVVTSNAADVAPGS